MKRLFYLLILVTCSLYIHAADIQAVTDPNLIKVLDAQRQYSKAYAANEAFLETGRLQYDISRSILYPEIGVDLDGDAANSFLNRSTAAELRNDYSLSAGPKLSFSQLLPTSGVINGSIADKIIGSGLEESNTLLYPEKDLELKNSLSFNLGLTQPLYFKNAFAAGMTQINESLSINKVTYLDNRNILIISAVSDYYDLVGTAYKMTLVEARLEINEKYEQKILKEHELGLWTKSELNTAKAARLQAEADLLKTRQLYQSAKDKIKTLYNIEFDMGIEASPKDIKNIRLDTNSTEELVPVLLAGNPDSIISQAQLLIAEAAVIIEEKNSASTLSAYSNYSFNKGISEDDAFSDSLSFNLTITLPIADGGAAKKSIQLKKTEAEKLRNEMKDLQAQKITKLESMLDSNIVYSKLDEIYMLQEETAALEYDKGLKELALGQITQKDLLDLQSDLEDAELSVLLNRIEYNLSVLSIYRLIGADLSLLADSQKEQVK